MAHEAQEASDADPANEPSESPTSAQPLDLEEVQSSVEAFLFLSDQPIKLEKLHQAISPETPLEIFATAMEAIQLNFQKPTHGIELAQIAGGYQFRTKPERASITKKLSKIQTQRLSSGAMETLAIIAYRQPVMKEDIDKIRGVDSSHFVRGLLEKRLIEISGRSELPGRPMLYTTTPEFLQLFGLNALDSMPSLRELEQMIPASQSQQSEDDPRVREMRRLVSDMKANAESILHYDPKEDEKILKEIRDRVNQIPTSTPTLIAQAEAEKAAPPPSEPASGPELLPLGQ
jgi:segregation and condensation protein B